MTVRRRYSFAPTAGVGTCYLYIAGLFTWLAAQRRCQADQAHLTILDQPGEEVSLDSVPGTQVDHWIGVNEPSRVRRSRSGGPGSEAFNEPSRVRRSRSGGPGSEAFNDRLAEGTYVNLDGTAPAFLTWSAGFPTGDAADCVLFRDDRTLIDRNCDVTDDLVCEYDGLIINL